MRDHYADALAAALPRGPAAAAREVAARAAAAGIATSAGPLPVDPVPVVLTADEWRTLEAGLVQRARALDAFVTGVYAGDPRVRDLVPPDVLATNHYLEPELMAAAGAPQPGWSVGIVGFDVVRRSDGTLAVLEDNLLTPGHAAVPAARELVPAHARARRPPVPVREPVLRLLRGMLGSGRTAILADDPPSWEVRWLARALGAEMVTAGGSARGFDAIWQRTGEDRLRDDAGDLTAVGRTLRERLLAGDLHVVNRIGCGAGDDKRIGAYMDGLVRGLLGEEPLAPSVPTLDLAVAAARDEALRAFAQHVFKPRFGAGARGIVVGALAGAAQRAALERRLRDEPANWVAQRRVALSVHPTVAGDRLEPRRIDLRLFAVRAGDGYALLPGGVARYAASADELFVNTSRDGGIKDVWVLPAG